MRLALKQVRLAIGLALLTTLLSGCFLKTLFGYLGQQDDPGGFINWISIGGSFGSVAVCVDESVVDRMSTHYECSYNFSDPETGLPLGATSTAELIGEFGWFGVLIDPVILQVPAGASNFEGSLNSGTGPQALVITEAASFMATPATTISAEAGQKFVIVEFPPSIVEQLRQGATLAGPFTLDFGFRVPDQAPVEVKALYTGKATVGSATYYVPLLPCVTDFAQVPAFTIPVAGQGNPNLLAAIHSTLQQNPNLVCDGTVYDLRASAAADVALFLPLILP